MLLKSGTDWWLIWVLRPVAGPRLRSRSSVRESGGTDILPMDPIAGGIYSRATSANRNRWIGCGSCWAAIPLTLLFLTAPMSTVEYPYEPAKKQSICEIALDLAKCATRWRLPGLPCLVKGFDAYIRELRGTFPSGRENHAHPRSRKFIWWREL